MPAPWETTGNNRQTKALAEAEAEAAALAANPELAEKLRRAKKICNCKSVNLGTIEDAIRAHALTTVEGVRDHTNASSGCGVCALRIEDILGAFAARTQTSDVPILAPAE